MSGRPSALDEAILWNRRKALSREELEGFGPPARKPAAGTRPYVKVTGPSKEDGPKGWSVEAGMKGEF